MSPHAPQTSALAAPFRRHLDHLAAERVAELQPGELDQLNILADPAFLSEADLAAAPKGLF